MTEPTTLDPSTVLEARRSRATIKGPLGWIGVGCAFAGMFGNVAANISVVGWLASSVVMLAGPVLIFLDINGQRESVGGDDRRVTAVDERPFAGIVGRMFAHLAVGGVLFLAASMLLRLDASTPPLRDLSPGLVLDRGPDRPNPGCPVRSWSVGEYLPEACLDRHAYTSGAYGFAGVERIYSRRSGGWGNVHQRRWIRVGRDMVGGLCALHAGCKITAVARDRFKDGAPEGEAAQAGGDFRETPGYVAVTLGQVMILVFPIFLVGFMLIESGFGRAGGRPSCEL